MGHRCACAADSFNEVYICARLLTCCEEAGCGEGSNSIVEYDRAVAGLIEDLVDGVFQAWGWVECGQVFVDLGMAIQV